ncbi:hypothetical protein BPO_0255 [Bergeyella porcorum]|uniref:DUF4321 domain-containing protein n=1 Tax=Bergeyella porcorum TaxID=1735111 RepID=A0AAU0F0U3_9FLAO
MKNIKIISFIISFVYVSLGTIVTLSSLPKYQSIFGINSNTLLWEFMIDITLPINLPLYGLLVVEGSIFYILVLQTIVFFICWILAYYFIKMIYKLIQ